MANLEKIKQNIYLLLLYMYIYIYIYIIGINILIYKEINNANNNSPLKQILFSGVLIYLKHQYTIIQHFLGFIPTIDLSLQLIIKVV